MKRVHLRIVFFALFPVLFSACGTVDQRKRDRMNSEFEDRKIRQILPAEILAAAEEEGEKVAATVRLILAEKIPADSSEIIKIEELLAAPADSIAETVGAALFLLTERSPKDDRLLSELFVMYDNAYKSHGTADHHVQLIEDDKVLYTAPILYNNPDSENRSGFLGVLAVLFPKKLIIKRMYSSTD